MTDALIIAFPVQRTCWRCDHNGGSADAGDKTYTLCWLFDKLVLDPEQMAKDCHSFETEVD